MPAALLASAGSLVMRLRRAGGEHRQQLKRLAVSGDLVVIAFCAGAASLWLRPNLDRG